MLTAESLSIVALINWK